MSGDESVGPTTLCLLALDLPFSGIEIGVDVEDPGLNTSAARVDHRQGVTWTGVLGVRFCLAVSEPFSAVMA